MYKRQALNEVVVASLRLDDMEVVFAPAGVNVGAVSYTHLDVYKRQEYYIGAQILKDLGIKTLRLLTNNPDKVYQLSDFGMEIKERVPIQMEDVYKRQVPDPGNHRFLQTGRDIW